MNIFLKFFLPYVINGLAITPVNSPVVKLNLILADGGSSWCSGTLIADTKVLTAAHCIRPYDTRLAGTVAAYTEIDGITYSSDKIKINPKFQPTRGYYYDLAIVTLSEPVDPQVPRIKLDSSKVVKGKPYLVAGYGYSNKFTDPQVLRIGTIFFDWWDKKMLVSNLSYGESSACFGDSGGAVLSERGIVGVVTGGEYYCDRLGSTSFYARLNHKDNKNFIRRYGR